MSFVYVVYFWNSDEVTLQQVSTNKKNLNIIEIIFVFYVYCLQYMFLSFLHPIITSLLVTCCCLTHLHRGISSCSRTFLGTLLVLVVLYSQMCLCQHNMSNMSQWSSTDYSSHCTASTSKVQMFSSGWLREIATCPASTMLANTWLCHYSAWVLISLHSQATVKMETSWRKLLEANLHDWNCHVNIWLWQVTRKLCAYVEILGGGRWQTWT